MAPPKNVQNTAQNTPAPKHPQNTAHTAGPRNPPSTTAPTRIPQAQNSSKSKPKARAEASRVMTKLGEKEQHDLMVNETNEIRKKLTTEWNKGANRNFVELDKLLDSAKVSLTKIQYMPLKSATGSAISADDERELVIARDILELGAKISVAKMEKTGGANGLDEFDRYVAQLKHYYFDLKSAFRQNSESMYEILGMNLLKLLSQNRIAEFHLELELFVHPDANAVLNNVYIKKAVEIEQYLTEGRYNKILALHVASDDDLQRAGLSSTGFRYFIEQVVEKSRDVIADVIENAYERLHTTVAAKSLHSGNNPKVLNQFAQKRNWTIESDGYVYFTKNKASDDILPSEQLVTDSLNYAKDLDTIV